MLKKSAVVTGILAAGLAFGAPLASATTTTTPAPTPPKDSGTPAVSDARGCNAGSGIGNISCNPIGVNVGGVLTGPLLNGPLL